LVRLLYELRQQTSLEAFLARFFSRASGFDANKQVEQILELLKNLGSLLTRPSLPGGQP